MARAKDAGTVLIRPAVLTDGSAVAGLTGRLATSFPFSAAAFEVSYATVLDTDDAALFVAVDRGTVVGYVLGFRHPAFYANGYVASVEEIFVGPGRRGTGIGRALMDAFEAWAAGHGCRLVSLATRRAAPFYLALGYTESALYLRKLL